MKRPPSARQLRRAFVRYCSAIEEARDPDEPKAKQAKAWTRAANARAAVHRQIALLEAER